MNIDKLIEMYLREGSELSCPDCGESLGKQSEVEMDASPDGCRRGQKIDLRCPECGHKWRHTCAYDTRG